MIDLAHLRADPDAFRASQRARGDDEGLVDAVLAADEQRRGAIGRFDALRGEQKTLGKQVAAARGDERAPLLARAKELAEAVRGAEEAQGQAEQRLRELAYRIANLVEDGAPAGGEDDYEVLSTVGEPPAFDFPPADHVALAEALGALDLDRGGKVSGARFYYLTGVGAQLEMGLWQLAVARAVAAGFTLMIPPVLVRPESMEGTGYLGEHAAEVYHLDADDLYLVGTSEVPLAAYHADEILDPDTLPRRYAAFSACFRREAGSHGRDTRGIFRVHQFHKVEMFTFCRPADAHDEHLRLLGWQEDMLRSLELPYRVIDVAAGDLGSSAARKYDCEGWVPSQGRYRELTSTSNCTTFQARRLGVRMRTPAGTEPVATLNGTLVTTRWLVALLEVHQQGDGSVRVPAPLRPYVGGAEVLHPPAPPR